DVTPGGPAAAAGMRSGDRIVTIDGVAPRDWPDVQARVRRGGGLGRPLAIAVQREEGALSFEVTPDAAGRIQIATRPMRVEPSVQATLLRAVAFPVMMLANTVRTEARVVTGRERVELSGPVGIVREVSATGFNDPGDHRAELVSGVLASAA